VTDTIFEERRKSEKYHQDLLIMTISHEMRNPLNSIIQASELLDEQLTDPEQNQLLKVSLNSSKLLLFIVNDILDMHQMKEGKLKMNEISFTLSELLESTQEIFKLQAANKGVRVLHEVGDGCPNYLYTDFNRLQQILVNLVSNALKFTMHGTITISVHRLDSHRLKFEVRDSGIGIREEDKPLLFKMFGRSSDSKAQQNNRRGVGLGLTICQRLATLFHGDIGFDSTAG